MLLPTLLSRIEIIYASEKNKETAQALEFISLHTSDRLLYLEKNILKIKPTDPKSLPKKRILSLLDTLEIHTSNTHSENKKKNIFLLEEYSFIRESILSPGSSVKVLGEYLCFLV
jgi:hypothetical protein